MPKHPHYDLIVAWAEDTSRVVQYESKSDGEWIDEPEPKFHPNWNWRFKPKPKPDVVRYAFVDRAGYKSGTSIDKDDFDNLKLTFDGETGKLKSAEVIGD